MEKTIETKGKTYFQILKETQAMVNAGAKKVSLVGNKEDVDCLAYAKTALLKGFSLKEAQNILHDSICIRV